MLCTLTTLLLLAAPVDAGALPKVLRLPEAMEIFRAHGFDLLVADAALEGARAEVKSAGRIANPQVAGAWGQALKSYDPMQCPNNGAGCSRTYWQGSITDQGALLDVLTGKRGLRVDVAQAALEAAKQDRADAQRTLEYMVKQQYLNAVIA